MDSADHPGRDRVEFPFKPAAIARGLVICVGLVTTSVAMGAAGPDYELGPFRVPMWVFMGPAALFFTFGGIRLLLRVFGRGAPVVLDAEGVRGALLRRPVPWTSIRRIRTASASVVLELYGPAEAIKLQPSVGRWMRRIFRRGSVTLIAIPTTLLRASNEEIASAVSARLSRRDALQGHRDATVATADAGGDVFVAGEGERKPVVSTHRKVLTLGGIVIGYGALLFGSILYLGSRLIARVAAGQPDVLTFGLPLLAAGVASGAYVLRVGVRSLARPSEPHPRLTQLAAMMSAGLLGLIADSITGPGLSLIVWLTATLMVFVLEWLLTRWILRDSAS